MPVKKSHFMFQKGKAIIIFYDLYFNLKINIVFSSITFDTPSVGDDRIDNISSQNRNKFECLSCIFIIVHNIFFFRLNIDRSIIRMPDSTSQAPANRPSTNMVVQIRTADVLSSIEYRELEKKKEDLSTQVDNLKAALKKTTKERKKREETHMCKLFSTHHSLYQLFVSHFVFKKREYIIPFICHTNYIIVPL